jgi:diadenylate cyclase
MPIQFPNFGGATPNLTFSAVLDILIVSVLIYQLIMLVRGRRAAHIVAGIIVLIALYGLARTLGLSLVQSMLANVVPYSAFALIVLFQSDIRRALARIGQNRLFSFGSRVLRRESAAEILLAVSRLSQERTGALIIVEREIGLRSFIESGVRLDAHLSRDLLLSVFQSGGALHDGAVILQGDTLAAAACFLPLSMNPNIARKLGTRHRAAIGVTEESDCLAIVVSEETGRISIASFGELESDVTIQRVEERLTQYSPRQRGDGKTPAQISSSIPVSINDAELKRARRQSS